jgi:hypothetical protein
MALHCANNEKYTPCIRRPKKYALFLPAYTPKWRIFFALGVYSRALLEAYRGRAPLICSSRGPSRRCTGYDSVAHPVICFSELGGCRGLLCGREGGLAARPHAPGCRPAAEGAPQQGQRVRILARSSSLRANTAGALDLHRRMFYKCSAYIYISFGRQQTAGIPQQLWARPCVWSRPERPLGGR